MIQPEALLQQYFGHKAFRTGQKQAIDAILSGRDVLAVMPTGAGKSVCYQISALLLPGVTIVISPLISLMKDQVEALRQVGIPAAYINSSISQEEFYHSMQMLQQGQCRILYVAPERLMTESLLRLAQRCRSA
ncbi:MAG: DEAD/DEAH box helicase [Ruminococcus callidus]